MKKRVVQLALAAGAAVTLVIIMLAVTPAQVSQALPPRPTPPGTAAPTSEPEPEPGAALALQLHFPAAWPWAETSWQTLWTVVQWQDSQEQWRDVTGWQGGLDRVTVSGETVDGWKTWWVAEADLGKGPFRWVVYAAPAGGLLGVSEPFYLPAAVDQTGVVEMSLEP